MKKLIYIAIAALFAVCSCHKPTSYDDSKVTNYISLELNGDDFVAIALGSSFADPGCKAVAGGKDVSDIVKISGAVDKSKVGLYPLKYTATNEDGFSSSVYRSVLVYDPSASVDITGTYTTQDGTYRDNKKGTLTQYSGIGPITIEKVYPGIFNVSCLLGGYYCIRAGYGPAYAMNGLIAVLNDNSLNILSGDVAGWGDSYQTFQGTYDPANGSLSWCTVYADMEFYVVL